MAEPTDAPLPAAFGARAEAVADLLKLLGNPQRLMIACLLAEGEFAVSEIESRLGIRQPNLSQQLGALREAGVIQGRREAKAVIYRLADARVAALLAALHDIFCPEGAGAFAARPDAAPAAPRGTPAGTPFLLAGAAAFARLHPAAGG
ncbi:MAG TPA: metalloregulator ArsR/SmtB family transcription factor [Rhodopila sp.]|uniref:metalloregulator ArsR/SmtB family transcription factor n=1 Tax=Rhodopila sp. TaxID=2480087 RepID=UPI002D0234C0|nr:metalloregulator ArsR/SmtB family transcription factor [Rhodopila sp.]HVY16268.1 metalloregulator ArsR/SmtB family transcription factor [Rhodopila sp.]